MRWDAVERELVVIATQLERLGRTFACLASELHRERENGNRGVYEGREAGGDPTQSDRGGAPGPSLGRTR